MYNYVVSAFKSSIILDAFWLPFLSATEPNLLLIRSNRVEVYKPTESGLSLACEIPIYGNISKTCTYRFQEQQGWSLMVLTERYQFAILRWNSVRNDVETVASGDMKDRIGKSVDTGMHMRVDPYGKCVAMHLYDRLIKVVALGGDGTLGVASGAGLGQTAQGRTQGSRRPPSHSSNISQHGGFEAFNFRLVDGMVRDMVFLQLPDRNMMPILAILVYEHQSGCRIKLMQIQMGEKDGVELRLLLDTGYSLDEFALRLVAIPDSQGGVLVISEMSVVYVPVFKIYDDYLESVDPFKRETSGITEIHFPRPAILSGIGFVDKDGSRILCGDMFGSLRMLALERKNGQVVKLHLEPLGQAACASCIAYCDNGVVFLGSRTGDSQLIRLLQQPVTNGADSMLVDTPGVQLQQHRNTNLNYFQVIDSFTNLGPIVDFCVVDREKQGQSEIVTCSGGDADGSLRVVRNGISMTEIAKAEADQIKELFPLKKRSSDANPSRLLVSYTTVTGVYSLEEGDEEMCEVSVPGLDENSSTLYAGNMAQNTMVQVKEKGVCLISCDSNEGLLHEWHPPSGTLISVASGNDFQLLVGASGGHLFLLEIDQSTRKLFLLSHAQFKHDISCLNLMPYYKDNILQPSPLAAIGLWTDLTVSLVSVPQLKTLVVETIDGDILAKSVQLSEMENVYRLIIALGDGYLLTYQLALEIPDNFESLSLTNKRKLAVGTKPAVLSMFIANNAQHVFAACDRPSIIHAVAGNPKLLCSNVSLKEVKRACGFDTEAYPGCLAIASEDSLMIGRVDEIQKLHIRNIPVGELPRRICHVESSKVFAVVTSKILPIDRKSEDTSENTDMAEFAFLRIYDDVTFELLSTFEFEHNEVAISLTVMRFGAQDVGTSTAASGLGLSMMDDSGSSVANETNQEYIVTGSGYVIEGEDEPSRGRLLVFRPDFANRGNGLKKDGGGSIVGGGSGAKRGLAGAAGGSKNYNASSKKAGSSQLSGLIIVSERKVAGAPYTIVPFNGKLLAGINSKVHLFKWTASDDQSRVLTEECNHQGHVIALYLQCRGDFVLVGDLQKSVSLLAYKPVTGKLEEIARDYDSNWMTAVSIIDDETFLGAENSLNMFSLRRNSDASREEDRSRLERVGEFHWGEYINRFHHGKLVRDLPDQDIQVTSSIIFGTVMGTIGVIASISEESYKFLLAVQTEMNRVLKGNGLLSHDVYRSFRNDRRESPARNFLDGDLIERFLDLGVESQTTIAVNVNSTREDLVRKIEELQRIH